MSENTESGFQQDISHRKKHLVQDLWGLCGMDMTGNNLMKGSYRISLRNDKTFRRKIRTGNQDRLAHLKTVASSALNLGSL